MFRNSILRYLNSAAVFSPDEPTKSPAEIEREKILASMTEGDKVTSEENKEEKKEEEKKEEEDKEEDKDEDEEEKEEDKEEDKKEEKTEEEKAAARLARATARMQKRIDKLTAENNLNKAEREKLEKQLAANPDKTLTEEEVQRRAQKLAQDIIDKRNEEEGQKLFQRDADKITEAAIKSDKDFMKKINAVAEEAGNISRNMIGILANELDHDNAGDVIAHLANDVDLYEEINGLGLVAMTKKLIRLSDKLNDEKEVAKIKEEKEKKEKKKKPLPDPIEPLNTGRDASTSNTLPANPTQDMERFVQIRNQQEAERRKARGGF